MDSVQMELSPVPAGLDAMLHEQLLDRRQRLHNVRSRNVLDPDFSRLLNEVDAALMRFEVGTYGLCDECHDPIEPERLIADPLIRLCLGDLTQKQLNVLQDDLQLAVEIQKGLLPKSDLSCEFWDVDFVYQPARVVSGDYVDVIRQDGELYFLLGDVSGKGMAASILMSNLHAMFHALIPLRLGLCDLMSRANHLFCESTLANQYATMIFGKMNAKGEIEFCNAGHLPPIVVKDLENVQLESAGLPLGMFCDSNFGSTCVRLEPGETLLLYTDGVTEANDHTGAEFGTARLVESINGSFMSGPAEMLKNSLLAITDFRRNTERNDDLTMMALKYTGAAN
jgi:phosphoserine phosphatase RsbU/P